jgi:soluble lytic murein transglycosylase
MRFSHFAAALAGPLAALALNADMLAAQPGADPALFRPSNIHVLSPADHDLYVRAFAAAAKGDWTNALTLGNQGQDAVARQLLQWRYALDRNSGAKFAEIDAALKMAENWPQHATLYARAEQAIPPDMPPAQIVQWFAGRMPASSIGRIRLGEALIAGGDTAKGAALIRQGWSEGSFDDFTENAILAKDAAYLTPEADRNRLDALLWRDETIPARRQMARVDAKTAAVAQARIALGAGLAHAKPYLAKVADSTDPALLYDWSRQLRLAHQDRAAHDKLLAIAPETLAQAHTAHWWAEVNAQARDALMQGDARLALALVDHAMLPKGDDYAEQQFLGGFITLRFFKDPARALTYFRNLAAAVSRPISKSRAEYWQGRAYEAQGDTASAYVHYRLAAAYPETFYGQLAMAHTQTAPVLHLTDTAVEAAPKAEIESDPLMPAIKVLADLGLAGDLRLFADREALAYPAPRHLKEFLQSLVDWGYPEIALRLAKSASYAGTPLADFAYPTLRLPAYPASGSPPQPALVHALIRQETEFDPYAVSPAGARGLMQMMLPSAKKAAKDGGLPYRPGALLTDTAYNIQLGMIEYAGHLANWGGSNVLAAAAYNAGPSNVRKWLGMIGDPRTGADALDWIEQIPFSETRNYVQRVLENMEVYRGRLAGKDLPLQILGDLYAPLAPPGTVLNAPVSATSGPPEKAAN